MKGRTLIIDDDRELCAELGELLESEGYEVVVAYDTFTAEKYRRSRDFDLYLLDLKLPGDGLKFLRELKTSCPREMVFVITGNLWSSYGDPDENHLREAKEQRETLKLADEIFLKPFDIDIFLARILSAINREKPLPENFSGAAKSLGLPAGTAAGVNDPPQRGPRKNRVEKNRARRPE